jgi:hypothetical protein
MLEIIARAALALAVLPAVVTAVNLPSSDATAARPLAAKGLC